MKGPNLIALLPDGGSGGGPEGGKITNPVFGEALKGKTGIGFFQNFIPAAIGLGFLIGVLVFFFVLIIGAIGWILSGGDKAAVESARGKITSAIIGIIVLFATFVLLRFTGDFFGINILTLDIGPLKIK